MSFIKCFDVVEMVTTEATEQFGSLLAESEDKKAQLRTSCEKVDIIAEQFGGISYEAQVDDETTDITVVLVCVEFETDKTSTVFYSLMQDAKKVVFKSCDGGEIQISFIFNGIWDRAV